MKLVPISTVNPNHDNPRIIRDEKYKQLVKSLQEFPEMAKVRPIVVNKDMIVLGGNMRLKAMAEAGWKQVPIEVVDWSEEKQKEFIIKDNVGYGEWSWDILANEWDSIKLTEWGLDVPIISETNYSDKNKEIDVDSFLDEMILKLKYSEENYLQIKKQLAEIAETPEQALWKLLGNK